MSKKNFRGGLTKSLLFVLLITLLVTTILVFFGCKQSGENKEKTTKEVKKEEPKSLIMATTTSTKDSGLLDEIIPDFEKDFNYKVKVIAVGTGEALSMGERGEIDILLVHARSSEDEFMDAGYGKIRKDVMYNDFLILGTKNDPAKIKDLDAVEALKKISEEKVNFVTRGDDSGTHKKELKIWSEAGIIPSGDWYISTGQGMGASLQIANEKLAYILTDRATYLAQKDKIELIIIVEGDQELFNPYGVIAVNWEKYPKVNKKGAEDFIFWLTSVETQEKIKNYGIDKYGEPLFTPDSDDWKAENK